MKKTFFYLLTVVVGFVMMSSLNSCVTSKSLAYFNNVTKDTTEKIQLQAIETIITKNDVLQISISTLDPITTGQLNAASASAATGAAGGLLVDETGIIKLPLLGAIKAEGLTKRQLADKITNDLLTKKIAVDPIVTVRIINYKITVLGEVGHPGVIQVPNEKITLPEAIAQAGDLTIYGKRNNILLIRQIGDKRISRRFSLNNDQLFNKDIYNLQNQDIIYVEANRSRAYSVDFVAQILPTLLGLVSFIIVIYTQVKN